MKICAFFMFLSMIHTSQSLPASRNELFAEGDYPIGQTSYEYPIANHSELTPASNNLTTQIRGELFFPNQATGNVRYPVLLFLPGKHPDCRLPTPQGYPAIDFGAADSWGECEGGLLPVASYLGFSYLGRYFASHGYIVLSMDVLLINNKWGIANDSTLNFVRARLVLKTIEKIIEWNRSAQTSKDVLHGNDLSSRFDVTQIGLMGHSRGGEGVRNAYNMLMEGKGTSDAIYWQTKLPGVRIKAVLEITPMYYGENGTRLGVENAPWAMILAGCEDDEIDYMHANLAYQQRQTAKRPNYILHVYGANHEYFNTEWQVGIPTCFGDQDPLWDVSASTFRVADVYPPAKNTSYDITLLKTNGSETQRQAALFALSSFFRAYVGENADPQLADMLQPSQPLPASLSEIGRDYFDSTRSIVIFNSSGSINGSDGVEIVPLQEYAEREFPFFAASYDTASVPPPQFQLDPPARGRLQLNCLDQIENALHVSFARKPSGQVSIRFNPALTGKVQYVDIQLARRSSCWFDSSDPSKCSQPRIMDVNIQIETSSGLQNPTMISLKSRYNLEFVRCRAMDLPSEHIAFLPLMFETVRIPLDPQEQPIGLKFSAVNGGSFIVGEVRAVLQSVSTSRSSRVSFSILSFALLIISSSIHR